MTDQPVVHARKIVQRKLSGLRPYDANARTHPVDQVLALVAIIRDSGFTNPILIEPDGRILAGHGRALAAAELGMDRVPCVVVEGLTEDQLKALRISDNKIGLDSGWDLDVLRGEMLDLRAAGFDLDLTGFTAPELAELKLDPPPPPEAPSEFPPYGEGIVTTYCCPKCQYKWSGNPHAGG